MYLSVSLKTKKQSFSKILIKLTCVLAQNKKIAYWKINYAINIIDTEPIILVSLLQAAGLKI